jgi:hypothetical protein
MTYPVDAEEIFVGAKHFLRVPPAIDLILRRRRSKCSLFFKNLQKVLAPGVCKDCLHLTNRLRGAAVSFQYQVSPV